MQKGKFLEDSWDGAMFCPQRNNSGQLFSDKNLFYPPREFTTSGNLSFPHCISGTFKA